MSTVTAAFAHALIRAAGLDLSSSGEVSRGRDTLYHLGVSPDTPIPDHAYFGLVDWVLTNTADGTDLVFRYAEEISKHELGVIGLAIKSAPTLRDSLRNLERYFRLVTDTAVYTLDETIDPAVVNFVSLSPESKAMQLRDECALAAVAHRIKSIAGEEFPLAQVSFKHACRGAHSSYEAFFGCPVRFSARQTAISICQDHLNRQNRLGDQGLSTFFTQQLEGELRNLANQSSLTHQVLTYLSTRLRDGAPQAAEVGLKLGMSERTFYRRLAEEGMSYRDVLQDAQCALARELLSDSECSLAEVAFLTGFAEQSTFSRAFKRWVGESPARFRQKSPPQTTGATDWQTVPKPWQKRPISHPANAISNG